MHISRLTRIAAAAALGVPVAVVSATAAQAASEVDTYASVFHHLQTFSCANATHNNPLNPIVIIRNGCNTRVWIHGSSGQAFCTSPNSESQPDNRFTAINLQVTANTSHC
jgi:hypothetical protein